MAIRKLLPMQFPPKDEEYAHYRAKFDRAPATAVLKTTYPEKQVTFTRQPFSAGELACRVTNTRRIEQTQKFKGPDGLPYTLVAQADEYTQTSAASGCEGQSGGIGHWLTVKIYDAQNRLVATLHDTPSGLHRKGANDRLPLWIMGATFRIGEFDGFPDTVDILVKTGTGDLFMYNLEEVD